MYRACFTYMYIQYTVASWYDCREFEKGESYGIESRDCSLWLLSYRPFDISMSTCVITVITQFIHLNFYFKTSDDDSDYYRYPALGWETYRAFFIPLYIPLMNWLEMFFLYVHEVLYTYGYCNCYWKFLCIFERQFFVERIIWKICIWDVCFCVNC